MKVIVTWFIIIYYQGLLCIAVKKWSYSMSKQFQTVLIIIFCPKIIIKNPKPTSKNKNSTNLNHLNQKLFQTTTYPWGIIIGGRYQVHTCDLESSSLVKVEKGFSLEAVTPNNNNHGQGSQDFLWPLSVT